MAYSSQLLERSDRPPERAPGAPVRRAPHRAGLSLGPSSDRLLANRASRGDRRAIATIFERYRRELYGFCLGILGEPQDAQDALQNTMVKVLRALPGEEREIALRPWLYRIAHNEAVELRRRRRPTQMLDGQLIDRQSSVVERAEQREQLGGLLKDLADLPDRQRTVLVMRELNGLDFAEIGAALDTSAAVVRQSLYEARRNIEQMDNGRGLRCDAVTKVLSDSDRRVTRRRDIRAHLRDCPDCQHFQDAIEGRTGILAAISPAPAAAAAGFAQAAIGSSSSGVGAALTGAGAQSAGAYGALKAVGAVAAVALLGTPTVQYGLRGGIPDPGPQHAHLSASNGTSPALRKVKVSRSARSPHEQQRVAASAGGRSPVVSARQVVDRRSISPRLGRVSVPTLSARPGDAPLETSLPAEPPAADVVAESRAESSPSAGMPQTGPGRASGPEKQSGPGPKAPSDVTPGAKGAPEGQEPDKQTGHPPKPEKAPGQTKKAAKPEPPAPPAAPPPPVDTEPAAGEAEPPLMVEGTGPSGKAKGHEKHLAPKTDRG
jgi:RNA polymerase sigma factor (sigma-70 family)